MDRRLHVAVRDALRQAAQQIELPRHDSLHLASPIGRQVYEVGPAVPGIRDRFDPPQVEQVLYDLQYVLARNRPLAR